MSTPIHHAVCRYLVAAVAALPALGAEAEPGYRVVLLDHLPPYEDVTRATDLNDHGQIVGVSKFQGEGSGAVLWGRDGRAQALPHLPASGGWEQQAYGINQRGQIVGWEETFGSNREPWPGRFRAVLWAAGGDVKALPDLERPGHRKSAFAQAINDLGDVVGESSGRAVLWDHRGGVRDLGSLPTYPQGRVSVRAINNARQVVGFAAVTVQNAGTGERAFLWSEATGMQDLGAHLGPPNMSSQANAINEQGQVVGETRSSDGRREAFVWSKHEGLLRLGGPRNAYSHANDINNEGQVAGSLNDEAILWSRSGGLQRLKDLIDPTDPLGQDIRLYNAYAINDKGEVTASADVPGRGRGAVLLTRVFSTGSGWSTGERAGPRIRR
ncbi:hypothetical protein OOT46_25960 [Aquabacterium sp. A7-Y]|uniref:hypothetical protein n=1 Tax=Aquabacterium sp. A7-Y TaxID=1349605 RepID=UPI00223D94A3|nr:hypothetical protein [Aquabacterium sp. A7-Y]MCW7541261.1 hypothetical protein [Aquabacterium sp. A7-Y]